MRKDVILGELSGFVLGVSWCCALTGVPFWECDGVTWWRAMEMVFFRSASTGCTLPCLELVGQVITRKWLHPIERMPVAEASRSNYSGQPGPCGQSEILRCAQDDSFFAVAIHA